MKSPSLRYEDRIVLYAVFAGVTAWIVDAAVDATVFGEGTFVDSLIYRISLHELYFRLFVILCFFIFAVVISGTLAKRKFAEKELRDAVSRVEDEKAKSEAIIAAMPDGISIIGRDFRILYQNEVQKAMVGDQLGKICYEAYSHGPEVCGGCPVALSFDDGKQHVLEKALPQENGTVYIEISAAPLRNAKGEIIAGIEAVRNISERKRNEESLKLFSEAVAEAMDGVQIVDLAGKVLYSNKAVEQLYGFAAHELVGRDVSDMNVDREFAGRVILPAIREQGRWSGELAVYHKSGRPFPVWLSASLVKDATGKPIAMVGIVRDMTERQQADVELRKHREQLAELVAERTAELRSANDRLQQEIAERQHVESELFRAQKIESLGLLAGGIAHDFNNLLGSIMGNVSLAMLDTNRDHPAFQQLVRAERASLRAQELTQQLLIFARGGAPVKRPIALAGVISEAAGLSLRGSRILHEIALPPDLWPVDADEGQMMQVFNNLLINADQAMPEGGIIRISGQNVVLGPNDVPPLPDGKYVKISVRDEGTGIRKEHLEKIFDPYFTTKQKGSGLGLAATYSIIRRHDGQIRVESEPGQGAAFHLFLPASAGRPVRSERAPAVVKGSGRVLIMDDEKDMRETTGDMLARLGYTVAFAGDGSEAIEIYRKAREGGTPFDAVIMDLTIPGGMGGKEAVRKLLAEDPGARVIVSSGYSQDIVMADYRAHGFCGMVSKPYRIRDLSQVVAAAIRNGKP